MFSARCCSIEAASIGGLEETLMAYREAVVGDMPKRRKDSAI